MMKKAAFAGILMMGLQAATAQAEPDFTLLPLEFLENRMALYNEFFHGEAAPHNYLDPLTASRIEKTRQFRTVMPGVLYRGGGPSGRRPLPAQALRDLCEAGFSVAVYGYTEGFSKDAPLECVNRWTGEPNQLKYVSAQAHTNEAKEDLMGYIQQSLSDEHKGPIYVHCWNGYHASGELAAVALRQFCPQTWDVKTAQRYWKKHANGAAMISRIGRFVPQKKWILPEDYQDLLCSQSY